MRHRMSGRKLGMPSDQRRALLRNLVSSLLWHDDIDTTEARAKEASKLVDRVITIARRDTLQARRQINRLIFEQSIPFQGSSDKSHRDNRNQHRLLRRIFQEVAPLYRDVRGGYVRIIRLGPRRGDAAMMVRMELTKGVSLGQRPARRRSEAAGVPVTAASAGTAPARPDQPAVAVPTVEASTESVPAESSAE